MTCTPIGDGAEAVCPCGGNRRPRAGYPKETRMLGMIIFLVSLSMLFLSMLLGFLVTRMRADTWPLPGTPELPSGLWLSTLMLLMTSVFVHRSISKARLDDQAGLRQSLYFSLGFALAFTAIQANGWVHLFGAYGDFEVGLHAFTFYVLTGLHAAHVLGGFVPLLVTLKKARRDEDHYGPHNLIGLRQSAYYWHFLDGTWILIFLFLAFLM